MNYGWIGAATDEGFTAAVEVTGPVDIRLAVSTSSDMSSPTFSSTIADADGWNKLSISGLSADTVYFWALEEGGTLGSAEGSIRTFPTEGEVKNFTVAAASCCKSNTNPSTFTRIKDRSPAFFMHMGDLHYEDIDVNNVSTYIAAYELTLDQSNQADLYKNIPTFYMWDDHDYATNNSDGSATGRPAALEAFRLVSPHPPIPFSGPDDDTPISFTFVCGRVRFVQLDVRSDADHSSTPENNALIGTTQLNWLTNLIETFTEPLMVIDVSVPWIIGVGEKADTWGNATTERTAISDAIQDHAQGRVLIIHGDSHMVGMDDGTNSNYATSPSGPGPRVCCFAPLNNSNSIKGGPYSEGAFGTSETQYGVLEFTDTGSAITVKASGIDATDDSEVVSMTWKVGDGAASEQIIYWVEDTADADALPTDTAAFVRADGTSPTRVRLNGDWWTIDTITQDGVDHSIDSIQRNPIDASGSLQADTATVSGSGTASEVTTGSGTLQAGTATVDGIATREVTGSGALQAGTATVDGSGGPVAPSGITHVGTETASDASSSNSLTVSKPAGVQEDDLLIAHICQDSDDPIGLPTGFTELDNTNIDGPAGMSAAIGYKVATGSEPASYDFTKHDSEDGVAAIVAFRGVDPDTPIDVTPEFVSDTSDNTFIITAPGITTITDGCAIVSFYGYEDGGVSVTSPPSGMETAWDDTVGTGGSGASVAGAWEKQTTAGSSGTKDFTLSDDSFNNPYRIGTLAIRPSPGVNGSGDLQSQRAEVSGTGALARDATGALQADTAAVAGIANREVTGSGALQAGTATATGSAALVHEAEGTLQAGTATMAGTAVREVTGSSALQAGAATVAGAATRGISGTGTLQVDTATTTGTGVMSREASGALQAQRAEVSGFGGEGFLGSGELQAGAAEVTGAGTMGRTATGALQAQTATVDGTAVREVTGTGALQADTAVVDGTGARGSVGTGALQADTAVVDGTASREITGQGALQATTAIVDGGTGSAGTGALQAGTATVSGTGVREVTGTGALQAGAGTTDGAAVREVTGTGTFQAGAASVTGEGLPFKVAEGALQAGGASVTASVATGKVASGDLQASRATLTAQAIRTVNGSGALQAQSPTVRLFLWAKMQPKGSGGWVEQDPKQGTWQ